MAVEEHHSGVVRHPTVHPASNGIRLAGATLEDMRRQLTSEAERLTGRVADALKATTTSTETAVREGDPRSAIVDEADEWRADLIVVGSHGRTGVKRWLLGSVAQAIVGHAPCSVEVVRRRESATATTPIE